MTEPDWKDNNPAGRLFQVFSGFARAGKEMGSNPLYRVWAKSFDVHEDDSNAIYLALSDTRRLFAEYKAAVETTSGNAQWILQDAKAISMLINARNLDQDWRAYADSANEAILRTLAHAAHELSTVASQTVLSAAELSDVRDTLEAAYAAIEGLDLDPQASASIRSALDGMQSALARYRTLGLEAFWEEWLRVLAHVIATEERAKEEGDQRADRWKPVRRAFSAFTQAAVKFARGADSITKISAAHDVLAKYLGDGAAT